MIEDFCAGKGASKARESETAAPRSGQKAKTSVTEITEHPLYAPLEDKPMDIGDLVLDLASSWTQHKWDDDLPLITAADECRTPAKVAGSSRSMDSGNPATVRAHSILMNLLRTHSGSTVISSRGTSRASSVRCCSRTTSGSSIMSVDTGPIPVHNA